MSRSRKAPYVTDQNRGKPQHGKAKRLAARAVRYAENVPSGKAYRKYSNPWDIRDWSFYSTEAKAKRK